jgi:hypothetical protein
VYGIPLLLISEFFSGYFAFLEIDVRDVASVLKKPKRHSDINERNDIKKSRVSASIAWAPFDPGFRTSAAFEGSLRRVFGARNNHFCGIVDDRFLVIAE